MSNFCLNTKTEIIAVKTMPIPPQIAYAIPSGIVLRANYKK